MKVRTQISLNCANSVMERDDYLYWGGVILGARARGAGELLPNSLRFATHNNSLLSAIINICGTR